MKPSSSSPAAASGGTEWRVHVGGRLAGTRRPEPVAAPIDRRHTPIGRLPVTAKLYVGVVCVAGAALIVNAMLGSGAAQPMALATLLAVSLVASLAKVEIAVLGSGATLTACHIVDLLALLMCGPDAAVLVAAWSGWTQCTFRSRRPNPVHQTAFSVAALAVAMTAAGIVFERLGGQSIDWTSLTWQPFAAAGTAFFLVNSSLVALAVSLSVGESFRRVWFDFFLSIWPSYLIGAALSAALAVGIKERDYWLVPLLAGTLAVLHRNYQAALARMNDGITDQVTGLPNKRFAMDYAARELARVQRIGGRLAVVLLDMDGFKQINDQKGHTAGDRALRHVGEVLSRSMRTSDLCSRYGGDEFLLVMPDCGAADATRRVQELQALVHASGRDTDLDADLSLSGGIAVFPEDGRHFDQLFANADARMYRSKFERVVATKDTKHEPQRTQSSQRIS